LQAFYQDRNVSITIYNDDHGHEAYSVEGCQLKSTTNRIKLFQNVIITVRPARTAAMPGSKNGFFALQGRHVAPTNVKFGSPMPNFTFIGAEVCEYSHQNCQNFEFWP